MNWIKKLLPSMRIKQDKLVCVSKDGSECGYQPIPIHELKLTPIVRSQFDKSRKSPVEVSEPDFSKTLGVIVPYRHREDHLKVFPKALHEFLEKQGIKHKILIAEQGDDGRPFNRAKLLNVGASVLFDEVDYFAFHDIDMLPKKSNYGFVNHPVLLAFYATQFDDDPVHSTYFSGVTMVSKKIFEEANGYSNNYWHWGCEDDDFFARLLFSGFTPIAYKKGSYESLPHQKSIHRDEQGSYTIDEKKKKFLDECYEKNKARYKLMRRGLIGFQQDGFNTLSFKELSREQCEFYEKVTVEL